MMIIPFHFNIGNFSYPWPLIFYLKLLVVQGVPNNGTIFVDLKSVKHF